MQHAWGYATAQRLRAENQDNFGVFEFPKFLLLVVCDGMGGHVGGAQASAMAVRAVHDAMSQAAGDDCARDLTQAILRANQAIYEAARKNHRLLGMGTTIVAAVISGSRAWIAHVGDSRAYMVSRAAVKALTRDHTMVNLFVDAELLTPEDAATHPEAHVLSRSLGVERQVEVDLIGPLTLQAGDGLLLCSDGVHGVVNDWELANVDWSKPQSAVEHLLGMVDARSGDDNATAVSLCVGSNERKVGTTTLPDIGQFDEVARESVVRASSFSDTRPAAPIAEPPTLARPAPQAPTPEPARGRSEPPPMPEPSYVVFEDEAPKPTPVVTSPPNLRRKAEERKGASSNRLLLAAAFLGLAGVAALGLVVVYFSTTGPEPTPAEPDATLEVVASEGMPDGTTSEVRAEPKEEPNLIFGPDLPPDPRRLPHRPQVYTQPPPGGGTQWSAVQAARQKDCSKALDVVRNGMLMSIDHATLYSQAWYCFNEVHQLPLAQAEVPRWEDFTFLVHHFEGSADAREERETEAIRALPIWYRPAVGGIEYRLEAWTRSGPDDLLVDVMNDLVGEPTIADHLVKDILMEAEAAAGLSRIGDPPEEVINWWARRVYVASRAMHGRPGRLIQQHRPEMVATIQGLLDQATTPRPPEAIPQPPPPPEGSPPPKPAKKRVKPGEAEPEEEEIGLWDPSGLPRAVALALAAALGAEMPFDPRGAEPAEVAAKEETKPTPAAAPVPRAPAKPLEPDLGLELGPAKVHRAAPRD